MFCNTDIATTINSAILNGSRNILQHLAFDHFD